MAETIRNSITRRRLLTEEDGAIGYIVLWLMGIPASILFLVFLLRGCN